MHYGKDGEIHAAPAFDEGVTRMLFDNVESHLGSEVTVGLANGETCSGKLVDVEYDDSGNFASVTVKSSDGYYFESAVSSIKAISSNGEGLG